MEKQRVSNDSTPAKLIRPVLAGAFAGLMGGIMMSAALAVLKRLLPRPEQYPLPPRLITEEVVDRAEVESLEDEPEISLATSVAHLAYGTAAGSGFALAAPLLPRSLFSKGLLGGLALWALGYLGWLPAFRILTPATEHPPRRSMVMIAGHLVWAWTAAWILENLDLPG